MMQIPANLPTDNLYKFKALSGVVLTLFAIAFIGTRLLNIYDNVAQTSAEDSVLEEEISILREEINFLTKNLKNIEENLAKGEGESPTSSTERALQILKTSNEMTFEWLEELRQKNKELGQKGEVIRLRTKILKRESHSLIFLFFIVFLPIFSYGLWLSEMNFRLWYEKLQKYQDLLIKFEVEKIQKEVKSKTPSSPLSPLKK